MEKSKYMRLSKKDNGITLIALVVTIIILIILASLSIKIVLGDNGLVEKVKYAKKQQIIETIREKLDLVKGSDYVERKGDNSIDTYFETLEREKIEPYIVTNKQKITDIIGIIEVDNKYSYIVTIENNNNIKIEYEGKVDEIIREPDKVTITITGEEEQANLPIILNANIKINGKEATSGKYVINTIAEELGTEDSLYTEQISNSNIEVKLEETGTYYMHTLIIDKYGRKQEFVKGPITIAAKYHAHINSCYTICGQKLTISGVQYNSNDGHSKNPHYDWRTDCPAGHGTGYRWDVNGVDYSEICTTKVLNCTKTIDSYIVTY